MKNAIELGSQKCTVIRYYDYGLLAECRKPVKILNTGIIHVSGREPPYKLRIFMDCPSRSRICARTAMNSPPLNIHTLAIQICPDFICHLKPLLSVLRWWVQSPTWNVINWSCRELPLDGIIVSFGIRLVSMPYQIDWSRRSDHHIDCGGI